ncbi:MAG TPA: 3-hydroxyacyl-ACP dehydratase FabZ [Acidobacteriota bacterium]|jgi:beta-hydroxyacyl-ACP dehydratase FabZ|nr:3-hydroxyacyl-ACP dehydratase FabZ [Acidobacteriota bacterium]HRR25813.1 3-hydroxyacyl-ACP dehydratase FabZ [Acidobacteriota bacterium]HRR55824.1 3-hydroxyacyl-ACP dehydratase FabZ [Acidobacteriota bacterium]
MDENRGEVLDIQGILDFLPHRYPFLLIDRILELEEGKRIVALKNVTFNEPFFQGHFPGIPIMPGVLIIEAMAQAGGVLVFKAIPNRHEKLVFFMGIEGARFRRPVRPGDQLRLEMEVIRIKSRVGRLKGRALVDDSVVAEAEVMFSLVNRDDTIGIRQG